MKQTEKLYAIYKNDNHIGNVREKSIKEAISLYLLQSYYSRRESQAEELIKKYKAIVAVEDVHYHSSLISD